MIEGGCRCGEVRYEIGGEPLHHAICHCEDCRRSSGSPMVAWLAVAKGDFRVTAGEASCFVGPTGSQRHFCGTCGTGVFFVNETMLAGIVDIQTLTLDDPETYRPIAHIQVAERLSWAENMGELPEFERFPPGV